MQPPTKGPPRSQSPRRSHPRASRGGPALLTPGDGERIHLGYLRPPRGWPFLTAAAGDQCTPLQAPETPVFRALREPREGAARPAASAVAGCSTDQPVTMPGWGQRQPGDGCACPGIRGSGTEGRRGLAGSSAESKVHWFRASWQPGQAGLPEAPGAMPAPARPSGRCPIPDGAL